MFVRGAARGGIASALQGKSIVVGLGVHSAEESMASEDCNQITSLQRQLATVWSHSNKFSRSCMVDDEKLS